MKRLLLFWAVTLVFGSDFLLASASRATPIGPSCGTCQGSIYELTYSGVPIIDYGTSQVWEVSYSIDTSGYSGGGTNLDSVALKVSSMLLGASLVDAPGGVMNWVGLLGGLNNNGCGGSGSGFDCVMAIAINATNVVPDGIYTWVFDLEVPSGGLFTGIDASSVKARYVDASRHKVGALVSEGITLEIVPEPSTAVLVSFGGALLAARRSKRR